MLPIPNGEEVERFRNICREKLGMEMGGQGALEVATYVLQISYLRQYGLTGERRRKEIERLFGREERRDQGDLPR